MLQKTGVAIGNPFVVCFRHVSITEKTKGKAMAGGILEDVIGDDSFGDPDAEPHQIRIPYLVPGVVKSRKDPLGLGRIVAVVEGLFEEGTDWLTPLTMGGGSPRHGFFNPPQKDAVVAVFFPMGLIGPAFYLAGGWAKKKEVPVGAVVDGDTTRAVFENEQWVISLDDRDSNGEIVIEHKTSDLFVRCKENGEIILHATAGKLQSDATEAIVLGDALQTFLSSLITKLNTHVHTGGTISGLTGVVSPSPGGPPSSFFSEPSGILSATWKVK